jgi:hypothetical protein
MHEEPRLTAAVKFRRLLPVVQCGLATLFGAWGLWERCAILSRLFTADGQTLWDTTARFHVWPWPFKLAVVTNAPAFLCWTLVGWPLGDRWPKAPEMVMVAPLLFFVALLWWAIGRWIDRYWSLNTRVVWGSLLGFTLICAASASVPSTTFYFSWGVLVWIVVGWRMAIGIPHRIQPEF